MITQSQLKELLYYDSDNGDFIWKKRDQSKFANRCSCNGWNSRYSGTVAGNITDRGYRRIKIGFKLYKAHRLAFLYMTGKSPLNQTDHINGIRDDNKWDNLREATNAQNQANVGISASNTSGYKGVSWDKRAEKWRSRIQLNGITHHLGYFDTAEEAHHAYCRAADKYCGEFKNYG